MYLDICKYQRNNKEYICVLLGEGLPGKRQSQKKTIANLSDAESGKVYSKQFGFRFQMQMNLHTYTERF